MRNEHGWRTKTEDGVRRDVTAKRFGKRWTLRSRLKGEDEWTHHEEPLLEDLLDLREILHAKYHRKRVGWEIIEEVEAMIRARGGSWEE